MKRITNNNCFFKQQFNENKQQNRVKETVFVLFFFGHSHLTPWSLIRVSDVVFRLEEG